MIFKVRSAKKSDQCPGRCSICEEEIQPEEKRLVIGSKQWLEYFHMECFARKHFDTLFQLSILTSVRIARKVRRMQESLNELFVTAGYDSINDVDEFLDWLEIVANEHVG